QETRVTWAFHPTLQMPRATLADDLMALTIDVQQLWKSYEGKPALQGLFLDARADPVSYKADIGYMPEAPTLPEYLTPSEFLGYVGRIRNLPRDRIATRT